MASAGVTTVDSTGAVIYSDDSSGGCTEFTIHVPAGSTQDALVNVGGVHDAGDFFRIPKGSFQAFRAPQHGIKRVTAKGNGGNADVYWGVTDSSYHD